MKNKRTCPGCKVSKHIMEFAKDRSSKNGLQVYCRVCTAKKHKRHRDAHPEKYKSTITKVRKYANAQEANRERMLKNKYNINTQIYEDMLFGQSFKCAICNNDFENRKKVKIDHCHNSNKVRGLLCNGCNLALGHVKDNVEILSRMITYLS